MKFRKIVLLLACAIFFLSGCGSNSKSEMDTASNTEQSVGSLGKSEMSIENSSRAEDASDKQVPVPSADQKVIYTAELNFEVKDAKKANGKIEESVNKYDGYIVQSNVYRDSEQTTGVRLVVRIPQTSFEQFLKEAEGVAVKVHQRNVSGSDVTEEYVDLESRLKSKKAVEARLLEFMEKATTTEDLLKISSDLGDVQEDIEQISGRIKYLDNQISYSTVTVTLTENKVNVPKIDNSDLNTGERIKKQFMTSINIIIAALSGTAVFVVGNLPIILLVAIIVGVVIYIIKRKKRKTES